RHPDLIAADIDEYSEPDDCQLTAVEHLPRSDSDESLRGCGGPLLALHRGDVGRSPQNADKTRALLNGGHVEDGCVVVVDPRTGEPMRKFVGGQAVVRHPPLIAAESCSNRSGRPIDDVVLWSQRLHETVPPVTGLDLDLLFHCFCQYPAFFAEA